MLQKLILTYTRFASWLFFSVVFAMGSLLFSWLFQQPFNCALIIFNTITWAIILLVNYGYHKFKKK